MRPRRSSLFRLGLLVALLALTSCSSIRVRRADGPGLFGSWLDSALTSSDLSPRSRQTLRQLDLEAIHRRDPDEAALHLHTFAAREHSPDLLFCLAEVHYVRGREAEKHDRHDASTCYYLCAGYAWHYLFPASKRPEHAPSIYDPRFRLACDLYNAAVAKCVAAAQRCGQLDPRQELRLCGGPHPCISLRVAHLGFAWKPEEFGTLQFSDDFDVVGLANQHRTYGLGVPLIGSRREGLPRPAKAYYPSRVNFPVTAMLRFEGGLDDLVRSAGRLELVNPLQVQAVEVAGREVPLETDLTTPLAYFLAHTPLATSGYVGFLRPDTFRDKAGIYMLGPYQPGKIPVVLVHGLLGSPLTWAPVYNELLADPVLRRRYQFWAYYYPTGTPYLVTAADLRRWLAQVRRDVDPEKRDRAFDNMVFVGHSMGGLVSKLMSVRGGDDFWGVVSDVPLGGLELQDEARDILQAAFYFEPVPNVRRVIFLGTPHHGSDLSPSTLGRIGVRLVRLPQTLMAAARDALAENPGLAARLGRLPTSIDLLSPEAPALRLLAARQPPEGVRYHTVIGLAPKSSLPLERLFGGGEVGDGVVPLASARLEGAESELVVPADHYHVHHHPLAILEVRRILMEHLRAYDGRP